MTCHLRTLTFWANRMSGRGSWNYTCVLDLAQIMYESSCFKSEHLSSLYPIYFRVVALRLEKKRFTSVQCSLLMFTRKPIKSPLKPTINQLDTFVGSESHSFLCKINPWPSWANSNPNLFHSFHLLLLSWSNWFVLRNEDPQPASWFLATLTCMCLI